MTVKVNVLSLLHYRRKMGGWTLVMPMQCAADGALETLKTPLLAKINESCSTWKAQKGPHVEEFAEKQTAACWEIIKQHLLRV